MFSKKQIYRQKYKSKEEQKVDSARSPRSLNTLDLFVPVFKVPRDCSQGRVVSLYASLNLHFSI